MDLFSESFMPGLFGMLRADSDESLQAAQTKFETALKVTLLSLLISGNLIHLLRCKEGFKSQVAAVMS